MKSPTRKSPTSQQSPAGDPMVRHKVLLLTALLVGLATVPSAGQVKIGVKAGASLSDLVLTGVEVNGQEARRGFVAGASLILPVSGPLGLQVEGSFVQKGGDPHTSPTGGREIHARLRSVGGPGESESSAGRFPEFPVLAGGPHDCLGDELRGHGHVRVATDHGNGQVRRRAAQHPEQGRGFRGGRGGGRPAGCDGKDGALAGCSLHLRATGPSTPASWIGRPTTDR